MTVRDRSWLRPAFSPTPSLPASPGSPALDAASRTARFGEQEVVFSEVEFRLLDLLVRHPGVMVTRDEVAAYAWGEVLRSPDKVTSSVKRIRHRLRAAGVDPDQLVTIHTLGYRWDPSSDDAAIRSEERRTG